MGEKETAGMTNREAAEAHETVGPARPTGSVGPATPHGGIRTDDDGGDTGAAEASIVKSKSNITNN